MTKGKPVFFCILRGLRGGYMPDDASHTAVRSFEEFCDVLESEVRQHDMAWNIDPDRTTQHGMIDALLRDAWDHVQHGSLELCVAISTRRDVDGVREALDPSYGITVGGSSRSELLEYRRAVRE